MTKQNDRWKKFISESDENRKTLPLMHTTRAYSFDEIIQTDSLIPRKCDVFNENLTYFYYGRPAYRARSGVNARLEFDWPIAFVIKPEKISSFARIFPFDSGAFAQGIYRDFFPKDVNVEHFQSGNTIEDAKRIVSTFYIDNKDYYSGATRRNVNIGLRQFEAEGVFELSRLPGSPNQDACGRRDERSSTVELQTADSFDLNESILAIVLPHPYLGENDIIDALKRWNVSNVRTYQTLENVSSDVWIGQIYQIVFQILDELNYFDRESV